MKDPVQTWAQGVQCAADYCEVHEYVSDHACVACSIQARTGYQLYNPNPADRSGTDTACAVYCLIDDLPLPHGGYVVTDRADFPEEMVPLGGAATLGCDPAVSFVESGAPHDVVCAYGAAFVEYEVAPQLVCGDRDFCTGGGGGGGSTGGGGSALCGAIWGGIDAAAACVDRAVPAAGYDCACGVGFSSRALRVRDPFDPTFRQTFTADMEEVEGSSADVVVACAYTVCAENEHVAADTSACAPCSPGSLRPAGDRSHQGPTECEHVVCAVDERVEGHVCVACDTAAGFYNARTDDSTGPDTGCTPRLCTGRYRVAGHDCAECPAGQCVCRRRSLSSSTRARRRRRRRRWWWWWSGRTRCCGFAGGHVCVCVRA